MTILQDVKNYFKYLQLKETRNSSTPFRKIGLLNPSIGSANLGDEIIYNSIQRNIRTILPNEQIINYPTQLKSSWTTRHQYIENQLFLVAGTNLLSSNLNQISQWNISLIDSKYLKDKVILCGCGWWQYQDGINNYTKKIYQKILHKDYLHSVRDSYTLEKLKSIGIENVVNTSCPTLWNIDENHCSNIPLVKSLNVVTTLTFYKKNKSKDREILNLLTDHYETVYLWLQGLSDFDYLKELKIEKMNLIVIPPSLELYDAILEEQNIDYVGTRLHAGIRALQKNVRTLILAVDNRASEIGRDINLNVINRDQTELILPFINNSYQTQLKLPKQNILNWKNSLAKFNLNESPLVL
jgi:polysaccharide pyruvyl transferase WcaK-like protein